MSRGDPLTLHRAEQRPDVSQVGGGLLDEFLIPDQDEAQAVLQPAISAAASHLTSYQTPAIEKAAALERGKDGGGFFNDIPGDEDDDEEDKDGHEDGDKTPEQISTPKAATPRQGGSPKGKPPALSLSQLPVDGPQVQRPAPPSPWRVHLSSSTKHEHGRSHESRGFLESAFGPSRQRSKSAGQDALKKLQKAFPSLSTPNSFLPSLPKHSFLSNLGSDGKHSQQAPRLLPPVAGIPRPLRSNNMSSRIPFWAQTPANDGLPSQALPARPTSSGIPQGPLRPPMLRRVTSNDSMLYHTLSRASSLGDDDRFLDVREMVNTRFIAIRDSLPDVPNFKLPSLAKLQAASKKSSLSLNSIFSNETPIASRSTFDHEPSNTSPKEGPSTALDRALAEMTGDLVIMGGYRGSVLRSAEAPHHQLWAPVKIGLNMRKANLEVGLEDEDEETMEERIIPSGMLQHIGPIDISRKLFKKLRSCDNARSGKLRIWDYGYDWRLNPLRLSTRLQDFLQQLPSNQPGVPIQERGAVVIAHSLGGLITRHVVNQRPELFAGVLYAGVPQRCINILGPLRNGDAVLFNDKLLTAQVNFSIRTSFALLPEDGFCFVNKNTGEEYPVDFYDPESWAKWHLSPCLEAPLPPYNRQPQHSTLASLLPNSLMLRPRADSKPEKASHNMMLSSDVSPNKPLTATTAMAPQLNGNVNANHSETSPADQPPSIHPSHNIDPERRRQNLEYLGRTLASIRQFRAGLAHNPVHQAANTYPPLAVLYGKSIPTVYAAQVSSRDAIPCADAYDDLLFRPGDGVVLAKEAMIPEGYSIVRGGRVSTERGHITMLGDLPALGRTLEALLRGRRKGIGAGQIN